MVFAYLASLSIYLNHFLLFSNVKLVGTILVLYYFCILAIFFYIYVQLLFYYSYNFIFIACVLLCNLDLLPKMFFLYCVC